MSGDPGNRRRCGAGGLAEIDKGTDAPPAGTTGPRESFFPHLTLPLVSYGVVMGLVTTALGGFATSGLSGGALIVVWIIVTGVLAVGAIGLADPAVDAALKLLRQGSRDGGPPAS